MRCGCPECGAFMVQAEGAVSRCVCPDCGHSCDACLGTNTVVDRALFSSLRARRDGDDELRPEAPD